MRLRPEQHLRRQSDFRRVREHGHRIHGGFFTLWWLPREDPPPPLRRVGVVASIAAVGHAVLRNQAKRRLRELFRRHQELVPPGGDLLLVAKHALIRQPFPVVEERFIATCTHLTTLTHA
jgi:ribonuclease P protein component|uniref:ribonuclease P protein component n=1 Tax=Cephaloticoccus sp. TaxID=1985742 RepID=UPI00404AA681